MFRYHQTLLVLSAIVAASLVPSASAAGRHPRDTGVACAHTENAYCASAIKADPAHARGGRPDRPRLPV